MTEMPDAIDVKCPACGHVTEVAPEWVGRQARCQCGFTFVVSSAVPTRVLAEAFDQGGGESAVDVVEDFPASGMVGTGSSSVGSVASTTFQPASAAEYSSGLPGDLGGLLGSDERVRYSETASTRTVIVRVVLWILVLGLPLVLVTVGALAGNAPGGVCAGMTGLGAMGVGLLVRWRGWRGRCFVITDRRTLVRSGSLVRRVQMIPLHAVVFLCVETGLVDRLAGTRSVRIHIAGQDVLVPNSSDVDRVVALLAEVGPGHDDSL
jgi:membrane protein YdbS with pleckstrin-like domain